MTNDANNTNKCWAIAISIALVLLVTLFVYSPTLSLNAITTDDGQYVVSNVLVTDPSWTSVKRFVTEVFSPTSVQGYYQPLTMLSLMLDCSIGGAVDYQLPFRCTNLILHLLNTLMMFLVIYMLFDHIGGALIVALLFSLHPMRVESVAWISERKTLLACVFVLNSLYFYLLFLKTTKRKKYKKQYYICSIIMFSMALLSKPISLPFPIMLLLIDWWPLKRMTSRAAMEKLPYFILSFTFGVIAFVSQKLAGGVGLPQEYGYGRMVLTILYDTSFYLHKTIIPIDLFPGYPYPFPLSLTNTAVCTYVLGSAVLFVLMACSLLRTRAIVASFLIVFVGLLPTMQIFAFSGDIASDKYMYIPFLGIAIFLGACFVKGWECLSKFGLKQWITMKYTVIMCLVLIMVIEAVETRKYIGVWADSISLHQHILKLSPGDMGAIVNLGTAYDREGDSQKALDCMGDAVRIGVGDPLYTLALGNYGVILIHAGKTKKGIEYLEKGKRWGYLAWVLATHQDPMIRDPERALDLALRNARNVNYRTAFDLDCLAACWAANGRYSNAVRTAKKALWVAQSDRIQVERSKIRMRIRLYQQGEAYLEDPAYEYQKKHKKRQLG